jgi:hypothetical protein
MVQPVYHFDIEQGTDAWHTLRRGIVTASAISKLLTATFKPANNDTSRALLYQLLAERILGESDQSFYNDDMARGSNRMPAICMPPTAPRLWNADSSPLLPLPACSATHPMAWSVMRA